MIRAILIVATLLGALVGTDTASAQSNGLTLPCDACRNPRFHPQDWANFAYNQVFGPRSHLTAEQANVFTLENRAGHSVVVDMNLGLGTLEIQLPGLTIPLPYPTSLIVQIILNFEDGSNMEFTQYPSRRNPDRELPVGRQSPPGGGDRPGSEGGGGGGGSGSGGRPDDPPPNPNPGRCGTTRVDGGSPRRTCIG